jgi:hypothetical protein
LRHHHIKPPSPLDRRKSRRPFFVFVLNVLTAVSRGARQPQAVTADFPLPLRGALVYNAADKQQSSAIP